MARKLTLPQLLTRINRRGFTDKQIAVALGRGEKGESLIQKVRTDKKKSEILAPAVRHLDKITRERKHPTATPLPVLGAPRRAQAVRGRERLDIKGETAGRVYIGTSRKTGKFHAYKTLRARIARAAKAGERVRLTTNWKTGQWMGKKGGAPHDGQQYTLWDDGMAASEALEELDRYDYGRDPQAALIALVAEYTTTSDTYLRVDGFASYSLQIYEPAAGWDVDDASEWA
jgi:hypothetical protein